MRLAALLLLLAGCEAVDNFDSFHVVVLVDAVAPHDASVVGDLDRQAPDLAPLCLSTLSGVGKGDFAVSLDVTAMPSPGRYQPIANQRPCGIGTDAPWWALGMAPDGRVLAQTNGPAANYVEVYSKVTIDDQVLHTLAVRRTGGVLSIVIDGMVDIVVPSVSDLGSLPPMLTENQCDLGVAVGVAVAGICLSVGG